MDSWFVVVLISLVSLRFLQFMCSSCFGNSMVSDVCLCHGRKVYCQLNDFQNVRLLDKCIFGL